MDFTSRMVALLGELRREMNGAVAESMQRGEGGYGSTGKGGGIRLSGQEWNVNHPHIRQSWWCVPAPAPTSKDDAQP